MTTLVKVNPISEAESNIKLENALINVFGLSYEEIQKSPVYVINYLVRLIIKRKQQVTFEEMKRKNQ